MDDKGGNWEICFVAKEEFSFPTLASLELLRSMLSYSRIMRSVHDGEFFYIQEQACIGIRGEGERSHATMTQDLRLASLPSALQR